MGISYLQCRAARALLGWSQSDLEEASEVAKKTIADFEREARIPYVRTLTAIQHALEAAGVEFLPDNGVRIKAAQVGRPVARESQERQLGAPSERRQGGGKSNTPRKPRAKPLAMSKEAQIRALRERETR